MVDYINIYEEMQRTFPTAKIDKKVVGSVCEEFVFSIPVRQSLAFGGWFLPSQGTYRIYTKLEYEDYLDMFNIDETENENAEDEYYEYLDSLESNCTSAEKAFDLLYEEALSISDKTGYIDDAIVNLFEKCKHIAMM